MSKVAIYVRKSVGVTDAQYASLENQIILLKNYALKNSMEIYKIYQDFNFSGTNDDRPALIEMLNDAFNNKFDLVLVKDLSRLGRNESLVRKIKEELISVNVNIIAIEDGYDSRDEYDLYFSIMNIYNEMVVRNIKKRQQEVINLRVTKERYSPNKSIYGYMVINKKLVIDEEAAQIVRLIFELYSNGHGEVDICKKLTADKVIKPSKYIIGQSAYATVSTPNDDYQWNFNVNVSKIVTNQIYTGTVINRSRIKVDGKTKKNPNPIVLENAHPPIISKELFLDCMNKRKGRKKWVKGNNPLTNFVRCKDCGYIMKYSKSYKEYRFYCKRCNNSISYEKVKSILIKDASQIISKYKGINDKAIASITKDYMKSLNELKGQIKLYANTIEKNDVKISDTFSLYSTGEITEEVFRKRIKELEADSNELKNKKNKCEINLKYKEDYIKGINTFIEKLKKEKSKITSDLLKSIIKEIVLTFDNKQLKSVKIKYKFKQ